MRWWEEITLLIVNPPKAFRVTEEFQDPLRMTDPELVKAIAGILDIGEFDVIHEVCRHYGIPNEFTLYFTKHRVSATLRQHLRRNLEVVRELHA